MQYKKFLHQLRRFVRFATCKPDDILAYISFVSAVLTVAAPDSCGSCNFGHVKSLQNKHTAPRLTQGTEACKLTHPQHVPCSINAGKLYQIKAGSEASAL